MGSIEISQLGKAYKVYPSRFARLKEWLLPFAKPAYQRKWILQNITLRIEAGESVGIIGKNGAGKSTLLKLITGTTQATTGEVNVNGRVAALLELGMGFHPDFTGRQNVFMAGQLQGMLPAEIEARMGEIEAFADIGRAIDDAVRTYSSGMQMRLAFAVATAVRPDILIVDEALAVGDAAFQRKCFRRIEEFLLQGTTLLYVSHDIDSVKKLCTKAAYFKNSNLIGFGPANEICNQYEKDLFGKQEISAETDGTEVIDPELVSDCEVSYGDGRAVIENVWLENTNGEKANVFGSHEPIRINFTVLFNEETVPVYAFMVKTKEGIPLIGTDSGYLRATKTTHSEQPGASVHVTFEFENYLAPGVYYLNCAVREAGAAATFLHRKVDTLIFRVRTDDKTHGATGVINLPISFKSAFKSAAR